MVSQRQKSALYQKEAVERSEKNLCVFRIIEAFQGSNMSEVQSTFVSGHPPRVVLPRVIQGRKVLYRLVLDPQVVVMALPPHVLGVLLGYLSNVLTTGSNWAAQLTECDLSDSGPLEHVTRGASVLVTMLEVIPRLRAVHAAITQDEAFTGIVLDLSLALLLAAAGPLWKQLQEQQTPAERLITGRGICGCVCWGAALLVSVWGTPGPDAQPGSDFLYAHVVRQLVGHPQGPVILRTLLDAASIMLLTLRALLQEPSLPQAVQEELSIHSGGALHHIGQLFSHPLMYNASMLVSPGGRHVSRLLLSACCLADLLPANAATREAIVPLLVARCYSLLVQLSEFRAPPLLDSLAASRPGRARLHFCVATATTLAQRYLSPGPFPENAQAPAGNLHLAPGHPVRMQPVLTAAAQEALVAEATGLKPGEPQLLLSLLRLLELAADDSGLRADAMEGLAGVLGAALAAHPLAFASRWCGGDLAVTQHLDDLVQVVSYTSAAVKETNRVYGVGRWLVAGKPLPLNVPAHGRVAVIAAAVAEAAADVTGQAEGLAPLLQAKAAALERALLLFKLLGNLHYYGPDLPAEQEGRFVRFMVGALVSRASSVQAFAAACARVAENMRALEGFLEPVCPDVESGEELEDVLLTQVEVNVFKDLGQAVAQLARTAWQQRDLPVPQLRPPGDVPDEEPEEQQDLARLAPAHSGAERAGSFDAAVNAAAAAAAAASDGDFYDSGVAAAAFAGSGGVGVQREQEAAAMEWEDAGELLQQQAQQQKRPRTRGGAAFAGSQRPPPLPRPPGRDYYTPEGARHDDQQLPAPQLNPYLQQHLGALAFLDDAPPFMAADAGLEAVAQQLHLPAAAAASGVGVRSGVASGGGGGGNGAAQPPHVACSLSSGLRAVQAKLEELNEEDLVLIHQLISAMVQADRAGELPSASCAAEAAARAAAPHSTTTGGGAGTASPFAVLAARHQVCGDADHGGGGAGSRQASMSAVGSGRHAGSRSSGGSLCPEWPDGDGDDDSSRDLALAAKGQGGCPAGGGVGVGGGRQHSASRGVCMRPSGKFSAELVDAASQRRLWLGAYDTPAEAARVYDAATARIHGAAAGGAGAPGALQDSGGSGGAAPCSLAAAVAMLEGGDGCGVLQPLQSLAGTLARLQGSGRATQAPGSTPLPPGEAGGADADRSFARFKAAAMAMAQELGVEVEEVPAGCQDGGQEGQHQHQPAHAQLQQEQGGGVGALHPLASAEQAWQP